MVSPLIIRLCISLVVPVLLWPAAARANAEQPLPLRVLKPCRPTLVSDAAAQSAIVRALIEGLRQSDLLVFVRCVPQKAGPFGGRLALAGATRAVRVVVIELLGLLGWSEQVAMLAHELQHASELARAPWVRDARTMEAHFRHVGVEIARRPLVFDTAAAVEIGERVRREVFARAPHSRTHRSGGADD